MCRMTVIAVDIPYRLNGRRICAELPEDLRGVAPAAELHSSLDCCVIRKGDVLRESISA